MRRKTDLEKIRLKMIPFQTRDLYFFVRIFFFYSAATRTIKFLVRYIVLLIIIIIKYHSSNFKRSLFIILL